MDNSKNMTLKLLLAGKNIAEFQAIKDAFNNEDAIMITATSMALATFLARKNQPDLIISQERLTDSDGLGLFYELKNEDELTKIPFALLVTDKQYKQNEKYQIDIGPDISKDNHAKKRTCPDDIPVLSLGDLNNMSQASLRLKEKILALLHN
jgi:response regulator RpfG family c-di-GMP phosphodiesterase